MKKLEIISTILIVLNAILIGIELSYSNKYITLIQDIFTYFFCIEILINIYAEKRDFLKNKWNLFDFIIVFSSLLPTRNFTILRIFRVFKIARILKCLDEFNVMLNILVKSIKTVGYSFLILGVIGYLYAVLGVTLFKLDVEHINYTQLIEVAPHTPTHQDDPFGSISETSFTLFRILTGEDWTDLRYNLVTASRLEVIRSSEFVVTFYHVSWFIVSAYLLLNLLLGSIVSNFQDAKKEE